MGWRSGADEPTPPRRLFPPTSSPPTLHFLRPEFVNRVDEMVTFSSLKSSEIASIVRLQAKRVAERLASKKIALTLDESAVEYLTAVGYDPVFGARPVKRAVQRELETGLAKALLRGDVVDEDGVIVTAPGGAKADRLVFERVPGGGTGTAVKGDGAVAEKAVASV